MASKSPQKLAASRANLTKARAAARLKYGKGKQTANQLASERANLAKARAKRHANAKAKKTLIHKGKGRHRLGMKEKFPTPLGYSKISVGLYRKQPTRKPTGRQRGFKKRISSTSYNSVTSWHSARTHGFRKRLHVRTPKPMRVKKWRGSKKRITPY